MQLKKGNRAHYQYRIEAKPVLIGEPGPVERIEKSDGTRMKTFVRSEADRTFRDPFPERRVPDRLQQFCTLSLTRQPIGFSSIPADPFSHEDIRFPVTGFQFGADEKGLRSLTYTLEKATRVTLWYDPKTLLPVKKVRTLSDSAVSGSTVEIYEEVTLDPSIPDDAFKMPEAKEKK